MAATRRSQELEDPRVRSYLIDRFRPLGAEAVAIINRLDEEKDITVRRALILSLGEYGDAELPPGARHALLPKLHAIYRTDSDPGVHGAAEWLLRKWDDEAWLKEVNREWASGKVASGAWRVVGKKQMAPPPASSHPALGWYVNGQGHTMVVIPETGKSPVRGSPLLEVGRFNTEPQHQARIRRRFAIAAKSVTVEQYQKFDEEYRLPAAFVRMANLPAVAVSWHNAAVYCNWLSKEEGIDPQQWCYETDPQGGTGPNVKIVQLRKNYLGLSGYRLATEAEWNMQHVREP